jgi:secondary thiamine-phosphate synthase enzyme
MVTKIELTTRIPAELIDITDKVRTIIERSQVKDGVCHIFVPHTTAAITINENHDPSVGSDIMAVMQRLIPWDTIFEHNEGNSAAHIKSSIIGISKAVIVENGRMKLGQWQGIFFCEFDGPRQRDVYVKICEG